MRILVASDTHGNAETLRRAVLSQPSAEAVFHLGDGIADAIKVSALFPDKTFYTAAGNCDFLPEGSVAPISRLEIVAGKRIFCTHGHRYDVKFSPARLIAVARKNRADVLLFGHTHRATVLRRDGLLVMNPGSLSGSRPTYGWIDIVSDGTVANIVDATPLLRR